MTPAIADGTIEAAVADIDRALVKIFTAMPERMKRKYKLSGAQIQVAIAFAMLSTAATMLTARTDAALIDGLKLRSELQALGAKWLLEHSGE